MRTPIFLRWITRSHEIFDIFNSRLDKLILVDKEQAKQLTMKAVLRSLFSVSVLVMFLLGANVAFAQTNNTSNQGGPDARPPVITNAQTPIVTAVPTPANSNKTGNQAVRPEEIKSNNVSISQDSQLSQDVTNTLEQTLNSLKQELNQVNAADPKYKKLQDAISRIETQLNNQ